MMPQPADIVTEFRADIRLKILRQIIDGTGKHKVLPDQKAKFIADVIESIIRIESAAPYTDTVHVGGPCILQKLTRPPGIHPRQQIVLRDIISAHGKNIHTVDAMAETLAIFILPSADCHGAKADAAAPAVQLLSVTGKGNGHGI